MTLLPSARPEGAKTGGRVWLIPTRQIKAATPPLRQECGYESLVELAQSISENGMLHPLLITFENGVPLLIAGHRRLRAAKIAGLREVPCLILPADRLAIAGLTLVENMQREDLHYFDMAAGMRQLIQQFQLTGEDVARMVGCSPSAVTNKLRLLRLTPHEQALLRQYGCSERHAHAVLQVEDEPRRLALLQQMVAEHWSIAKTEQMAARPPQPALAKTQPPAPLVQDMRLFINTINHAVDTMRRSGIDAKIQQDDHPDFTELTVRIPKRKAG